MLATNSTTDLVAALCNGNFLFTGGILRDLIIANPSFLTSVSRCIYKVPVTILKDTLAISQDIDIATIFDPKKASQFLDEHCPSHKRVLRFATNTIIANGVNIDITSTRVDYECNGKNAKMKFGVSYYRDSFRRDFTFNALYANSQGLIFDFHSGIKHLLAGEIHFIGHAKERIIEDYTRIKRYYDFSKRFNMKNQEIESAIDYIIKNSKHPIIMR